MADYHTDVYAWSQRQGALLRRLAAGERVNHTDLDWPNVAEAIETIGRSARDAMARHIADIVEHLIKMRASPAKEPRAGWRESIVQARAEIDRLLEDSPSLRLEAAALIERALPKARRFVEMVLARHHEESRVRLRTLAYSEEQVLSDWFFPDTP
jgi:hypothetical protein